jgi:cyclic pyranopterin phosphate synthase
VRAPDVTNVVPTRRMSVARGTLAGNPALPEDALATARVAAVLAVKDASRTVPFLVPFQVTDVFCDLQAEAAGLVCTVTVQAFARTRLTAAALCGVAAALVTLLESLDHPEGARIEGLHAVQDVEL